MSRILQMLFPAVVACASVTMAASALSAPKQLTVEHFVHMSFHGTMDQVGGYISSLRHEFESQKVPGVTADDRPFLVIHGNPDKTRDLNMDLGFSVQGSPAVKPPLKSHRLHFPKAEAVSHRGPYSGLSEAHQEIMKNAKGQEQNMVILHLLSNSGAEGDVELIQPLK